MKLKFLIFFIILLNLASVSAILNPPFKPCSENYYKEIWETILKEPYNPKPISYHEGPDIDGNCSNFDLRLTKSGDGYKEVSFVLVTITTSKKEVMAGNFQVQDPDNTWSLPTDFLERYYQYLFADFEAKNRFNILVTKEEAKSEYERLFKGATNLNQWEPPPSLTGNFKYKEESTQDSFIKTESIEVAKRLKYAEYVYSESTPISLTITTTSTTTSSTSGIICSKGESRPCPLPGICSFGAQVCLNNAWSVCSIGPKKEVCFDKLDNDCDGIVDENCLCIEGTNRSCGQGIGICNQGTQTCLNGKWSTCQNVIKPLQELNTSCNNLLDDDCDGLTDSADPDCKQTVVKQCNYNNQTDSDETGIDCGGLSCPPCLSCTDSILNQGETKINVIIDAIGKRSDCGGLNCPTCPTCNDNTKNQEEEGVDCGGPCSKSCDELKDSDGDGITDAREREIGTDTSKKDTDDDGLDDLQDAMPLCPNQYCDESHDEDPDTCPQDCGSIPIFPIIVIFFVFIPLIGLVLYFLIKKQKRTKKQQQPGFKIHSSFLKSQYKGTKTDKLTEQLKKIK